MALRGFRRSTGRTGASGATLSPSFERAVRRAASQDSSQLHEWLNTTILQLGMAYDAYRYHDGPIEEVGECISVAGVLCAELAARQDPSSTS
jgi:hypothetical protein